MQKFSPHPDRVTVIDTQPVTVVAIGLRGGAEFATLDEAEAELEGWLEENTQWERAGDTRRLGYNGPNVRPADRWWEVQIPIQSVPSGDETDSDE